MPAKFNTLPPRDTYRHMEAVTPDDDNDLDTDGTPHLLYVGTAGDLSFISIGGETHTVAASVGLFPVLAKRVLLATTAVVYSVY